MVYPLMNCKHLRSSIDRDSQQAGEHFASTPSRHSQRVAALKTSGEGTQLSGIGVSGASMKAHLGKPRLLLQFA